jgi:hypothetical protein
LRQAARAALTACQRLETEPGLNGKFRFNGREVELYINDRLLAPNDESTREVAQLDVDAFFSKLFGGKEYSLSYGNDPRRLFAVSATSSRSFQVSELLSNLGAA